MVNIQRLKTALKERNISIKDASDAIGMDEATLYRRFQRQGEKFTIAEVDRLAKLLLMDKNAMTEIFFDEKPAETQVS